MVDYIYTKLSIFNVSLITHLPLPFMKLFGAQIGTNHIPLYLDILKVKVCSYRMVEVNIMTTWTWLSALLVSKPPVCLQQILWMNKLYHNLPLLYLRNLQGMSFDISFPLFCINFPTFEILHIFILVKDPSSNILLLFS